MLIDRQMQSAFMPELHRWILKLTARHVHACPPGNLLITMVKKTVIYIYKTVVCDRVCVHSHFIGRMRIPAPHSEVSWHAVIPRQVPEIRDR